MWINHVLSANDPIQQMSHGCDNDNYRILEMTFLPNHLIQPQITRRNSTTLLVEGYPASTWGFSVIEELMTFHNGMFACHCFLKFLFFIQQVLISYLFYTYLCIHVNPNLPIHPTTAPPPTPLSPLGVHTFVLYICCLYFCFANRFICTIFLDSTYIYVNIRYLFFSFWLSSLCMTVSRSIHTCHCW